MRLVLSDLWGFVKAEFRGGAKVSDSSLLHTPLTFESEATSNTSVVHLLAAPTAATSLTSTKNRSEDISAGQDVYIAYPDTPCYLRPAIVRDTVLGVFDYADLVRVVATQDHWVRVANDTLEGWTERTHLTTSRNDVQPTFSSGEVYDADDPETLKLRTWIRDEFGVAALRLPALNCEYVWFQMMQKQSVFNWPPLRPRTPGRWSELLRPESSVLVSAVPMTGSIMEYDDEQKTAELWYVESVTPEESVTISGFTGEDKGFYIVKTLTKDEWTKLQPRYIIKK